MDVTALAGDLKTHPLLNAMGAMTEAVIPLHGEITSEFPLRFDINMLVPKRDLDVGKVVTGSYQERATLIFLGIFDGQCAGRGIPLRWRVIHECSGDYQ